MKTILYGSRKLKKNFFPDGVYYQNYLEINKVGIVENYDML